VKQVGVLGMMAQIAGLENGGDSMCKWMILCSKAETKQFDRSDAASI